MTSRPLRVATVITRLAGGAGRLALRGALALDRDSYRSTIITGEGDRLLDQARAAGLEVLVEPALHAPIAPYYDLIALRRLALLLGGREFDVVHTHCAKAGTLGRLAAHRVGVPRIVHTFHGFPFHEFQSRARRQAYLTIERRLGRITDLALCVGTGVAVEAVRRGLVAPNRIRTIGVVVDRAAPTRSPSRTASARRALALPADSVVVGAAGRLTYQKAPEDFVAALRALARPEVIGVWIGGGELAEQMARLVRSTPALRVLLAGERADVPALLPAFDVFALPSRYEGLPTAVAEAMVARVPVVATAVNAVADLVVPGRTGLLVPPGRPDLFADAVRYLLDTPDAAARLAADAAASLGDRYDLSVLRAALDAAYLPGNATVGGSPGTPHTAIRVNGGALGRP